MDQDIFQILPRGWILDFLALFLSSFLSPWIFFTICDSAEHQNVQKYFTLLSGKWIQALKAEERGRGSNESERDWLYDDGMGRRTEKLKRRKRGVNPRVNIGCHVFASRINEFLLSSLLNSRCRRGTSHQRDCKRWSWSKTLGAWKLPCRDTAEKVAWPLDTWFAWDSAACSYTEPIQLRMISRLENCDKFYIIVRGQCHWGYVTSYAGSLLFHSWKMTDIRTLLTIIVKHLSH
jgi:hypothetical protein